jgi:hypothetical protein
MFRCFYGGDEATKTWGALLSVGPQNVGQLRHSPPREERELMIAANNGHVLAFDNLFGLPPWLSDALCRLASGGSFAVRQLYTDDQEVLFKAARPALLSGIRMSLAGRTWPTARFS